jgi:hypothetical protein
MWIRGTLGVLLCAAGVVWVAQGIGALHGSFMTGKAVYAALGAVVLVLGLGLLIGVGRQRRRHRGGAPS